MGNLISTQPVIILRLLTTFTAIGMLTLGGAMDLRGADPPQAILQVSPLQLQFEASVNGAAPHPQSITISNGGDGLLKWHAYTEDPWIDLGAGAGTLSPGRSVQLNVFIDPNGLEKGEHQGIINVEADGVEGSPVSALIDLTISLISRGVRLSGADEYHANGITGKGVKVGIIDLGFAGVEAIISQGELPESLEAWNCLMEQRSVPRCEAVSPDALDNASGGQAHGTAVAEIIHDMAPEAELHLLLVNTATELGMATLQAIDSGIDVINHSVAWFNDGSFYECRGQTGGVVRDAYQNGIFWVNAAGNDAQNHYEGLFQDQDDDHVHDDDLTVMLEEGDHVGAYLTWDAWPHTSEDFDLYLRRGTTEMASSTNTQKETTPDERLFYLAGESGEYQFQIEWAADGSPPLRRRLEMFVFPNGIDMQPHVASSSLPEPANCAEAFVVGAVNPDTLEVEPYSSRGPTNTGLPKPDLVAPDCVATATSRAAGWASASVCDTDGLFAGTAVSAPYVAGAAALLVQESPTRDNTDLSQILRERAIPKGDRNAYGAGILHLRPDSAETNRP